MNTEIDLPRCSECGGKVELKGGENRRREFRRGMFLDIPDDFLIPQCIDCGEEFMIPEVSKELDNYLNEVFSYYEDDDGNKYSDSSLWEEAKKYEAITVNTKDLLNSLNEEEKQEIESMIDDYKRINECLLEFPIILTPDNHLADGYHRICKTIIENIKEIKVVKFNKMPKPDGDKNG